MSQLIVAIYLHFKNQAETPPLALLARYIAGFVVTLGIFAITAWALTSRSGATLNTVSSQLTYSGAFAHDFSLVDIPKSLYGATKAFITFPGLADIEPNQLLDRVGTVTRVAFYFWYGIVLIGIVLPFAALVMLRKQLGKYTFLIFSLLGWLLVQLVFAIYWEPTYIKWMTGSLVAWWALTGIMLSQLIANSKYSRRILVSLGVGVAVLFFVNLGAKFLPNAIASNNPWLQIADTLGENSQEKDLFVSVQGSPLDLYIPYFASRQTISYPLVYLQNGRDSENAKVSISAAIARTIALGGHIYLLDCNGLQADTVNDLFHTPSLPKIEQKNIVPNAEFNPYISVCELDI